MERLWQVVLFWLVFRVLANEVGENDLSDNLFIDDGESDLAEGTALADDLIEQTARMFQKPVREGNVGVIVQLMTALQKTPKTLHRILNWQDSVGATALHWCAFYGSETHAALAKTFLKIPGTDASIYDNHNNSACHTACMKGHASVLAHLLDENRSNGCDPFTLNANGMSCLHYAAKRGDAQSLALLDLNRMGIDVDQYSGGDSQPTTPLYLAVEAASPKAVRVLVDAGASGVRGRRSGNDDEDEGSFELARHTFNQYDSMLKVFGDSVMGRAGLYADRGPQDEPYSTEL